MTQQRIFDGKTFTLHSKKHYKADAEVVKYRLKQDGYNVRLVKSGDYWLIYKHNTRESSRRAALQKKTRTELEDIVHHKNGLINTSGVSLGGLVTTIIALEFAKTVPSFFKSA